MRCFFDSSFLDLEIINNIRFSLREVDIVSCIINGRSPKFIAHLLDISPKTVEAHIRNIKIKINCSSKEQIVSFIEKSNKHQLISQHYRDLIVNTQFEKSLQKISAEITNKNLELQIICLIKNDNQEDIKCCKLIKHLSMAGIKANLEFKSLNNLDFSENNYVLLCSAQTVEEICNRHKEQIKNIIFFTDGYLDIEQKDQIINYTNSNNYYSATLELISKFYSSQQMESLISKFRSLYKDKSFDFFINDQIAESKYSWNKYKILTALCLILTFLIYFFLHFYTSTRSKDINLYTQFIGKDILLPRKNLIHKIDTVFKKQNGIKYAILIGEGGMGKTVISRHYLQSNDFKVKAEINAETYNSLSDSFANLAITLANTKELQEKLSYIRAITDYKRRNKQVFLFVLSQLKEIANWCLLFDNVDDFNLIRDFIPSNDDTHNDGKIIITTRNENFKNITIFPQFCAINIPLLTANEQEELFSKIIYGKSKENDEKHQPVLKNFLKNIPFMPLDICAAAFYIKNTHISFDDYLKISNNPCQSTEKIQSTFLAEGINYDKTRYGIISSVFEKIIKINADFKELLLFICLVDSQNIPRAYLEKCKDHTVVHDFIHNLRRYSLITEKNDTFSIHRSTQKIGLKYILSLLSDQEKIKYLDEIVKIMTPYEDIWWLWSKNPKEKLGALNRKKLLPHLEFLLVNLNKISPLNKLKEYNIKILLASLYCYEDIKNYRYMQKKADEIISLNSTNNYLDKFDLAVLFLENVYLCFNAGCGDISEKYIDKCLKLCEQSQGFENVKANCLSYKGRYCISYGDKKKGLFFLRNALEMLKKVDSSCIFTTTAHVYRQYSYCICNHYINKGEVYNAISRLLEVLNLLNASVFFHKNPEQFRDNLFLVPALRLYLADAYNSIGAYDKALECEEEVYFLYNKLKKKGIDLVSRKAILGITNSLTLLRKERIQEAYDILTESIDTAIKIGNSINLFFGLVYRSEACIRLGKLDEAYNDCIKAEQFIEKTDFNYNKLMNCVRYYNMGIIHHRQNRLSESSKYFQKFLEHANIFCRDFLKKELYEKLVFENVFEVIKDELQIKTYLQNSLKIFTAIYGENHSFVKNYVKKNFI